MGVLTMAASDTIPPRDVANIGIEGIDDILVGGFTRNRLFLVEGLPGSRKTTLAMRFRARGRPVSRKTTLAMQLLLAGAAAGEPVLYVTLSETADELRAIAESHGWNLDGGLLKELTRSGETHER